MLCLLLCLLLCLMLCLMRCLMRWGLMLCSQTYLALHPGHYAPTPLPVGGEALPDPEGEDKSPDANQQDSSHEGKEA